MTAATLRGNTNLLDVRCSHTVGGASMPLNQPLTKEVQLPRGFCPDQLQARNEATQGIRTSRKVAARCQQSAVQNPNCRLLDGRIMHGILGLAIVARTLEPP